MKAGNIAVEGKIGYQSGFMAHAGKIIALGGAGARRADALWAGEVWVAGPIELKIPIYSASISVGALSAPAKSVFDW